MSTKQYFLEAIEDLGRAQTSMRAFLVLLRADLELGRPLYGEWTKTRVQVLSAVVTCLEGAFRLMKHVQWPEEGTRRTGRSVTNLEVGEEMLEEALKGLPR